ncbi:FAD:protein FMN transferase [Massilia oculi]|uniref:FAD:protein FMN transferase n=1 Tax=Massilia oculi TaxID=945844 RepID=A0A2S2DNF2_9BURK|nr:FAD:protein FMN transferase [Massilia oculi]AWL06910.1 hypothetical protein DIR46_22395 [Massilia oculi]
MFHHTMGAMNTRFSMVLPAVDTRDGMVLVRHTQALLREQERMMSRFIADGDLATLNRAAARGPAPMPDRLCQVLDTCRRHHRLTGGAFDIAQGARRRGHGMDLLHFDAAARTLHFAERDVQLDLGGIGKGIALDVVGQYLIDQGVEQALLSFGESSVSVIGAHPAGDCWPIGVEHLYEQGRSLHRFALRDAAMSTSGNRDGQAHIVIPASGELVEGCRTISVACASAADAEALSTALFVLPAAQRAAVLRNYPGAQAVEIAYLKQEAGWTAEKRWQHE